MGLKKDKKQAIERYEDMKIWAISLIQVSMFCTFGVKGEDFGSYDAPTQVAHTNV